MEYYKRIFTPAPEVKNGLFNIISINILQSLVSFQQSSFLESSPSKFATDTWNSQVVLYFQSKQDFHRVLTFTDKIKVCLSKLLHIYIVEGSYISYTFIFLQSYLWNSSKNSMFLTFLTFGIKHLRQIESYWQTN